MGATTGADRPRKKIQRKRLPLAPYFLSLLAVLGVLWAASVAGAGWKFPTPKLGLDLQGGLSMTLTAYQQGSNSAPSSETMDQARQIIENRVNSTGVAEPEVYVEGSENIVVNVAGTDTDEESLRDVGAPAELRFRIVTDYAPDYSALEDEMAAAQEDAAGEDTDPEEEPTESAAPEDETDDADAGDSGEESTDEDADEDDTEGVTGSPQVATTDESITLDDVWADVGEEAAELAQSLNAPPADDASAAALEPFGDLTPEAVSLLPANVQFFVPSITCEQ